MAYRKLIDTLIEQHRGRFVHSAGDSVLAEFVSVVNAVQCAVEIQTTLKMENATLPAERRMEFRIGINLGDVIADGVEIYGDGVNVAARLESLADPGAIFISGSVREQLGNKLPLGYADLGERSVKNIAHPVRVFRVLPESEASERPATKTWAARKYVRRCAFSIIGIGIIAATIVLVQHVSFKPPHTHASIPPAEQPALPLPSIPSIAVLPFTNLSGDPSQEYFRDGISDQLINNLSRLPGLFVIARNSSFAYRGKTVREHEIGRELGVKYVLEGSVREVAGQVRIGVQLADASSGTEMWTQHFDRRLTDIFSVQDEIVGKVVTTLDLLFKLGDVNTPQGASSRPTDNLEAYDDFLRATEFFWRMTRDDNVKARQWDEKAIALDPKFAEAYASLAWTRWMDAWNRWSDNPPEELRRASEATQKALTLDESNCTALGLLSEIDWLQMQFDQAVSDARRAVAINPNSAAGYHALSDALLNAGEPEEAVHAAERAIRLDPVGQELYVYDIGLAYVEMGHCADAVPLLKRNLVAYPGNLVSHLFLAAAYAELGRERETRAETAEIRRIAPQLTLASLSSTKDTTWNKRLRDDLRKAGLK
jgi:adenylate cyclase